MTRNAMLPVVDLVMDDLDDVFVAENPEVTRKYKDQAGNISEFDLTIWLIVKQSRIYFDVRKTGNTFSSAALCFLNSTTRLNLTKTRLGSDVNETLQLSDLFPQLEES